MIGHKRHRDPHPHHGALSKVRREANCLGDGDALFKLGHTPSPVRNMAVDQIQVRLGVGHGSNTMGDGQHTEREIHVEHTRCAYNRENGYDTCPSGTLVVVQHDGALHDVALNLPSNPGRGL